MKVNLTLDVTERDRFVIAKFFAPAGRGPDRTRTRATRVQVRRFVTAMLHTAVNDYARDLPPRSFAAATRLLDPVPRETLPPPREQQRVLQW